MIKCYGCSALVEDIEGTPHKYIGASQGCWNLYTEILAKEYGEYNYPELTHRLTVDTYAIQHPGCLPEQSSKGATRAGQPGWQSIQSVNVHLISLYAVLVLKMRGSDATKLIGKILRGNPVFEWLDPPVPNGTITVVDVLKATNQNEHEVIVEKWAEDVFGCWFSKHGEVIKRMSKQGGINDELPKNR
jgi:hypothetical protein